MAKALKKQDKEHCLLSPSSASRWMVCSKSARFAEQFENKASAAADEGSLAHLLGESMIRQKAGRMSRAAFEDVLKNIRKNKYYSDEMYRYAGEYSDFVISEFEKSLEDSLDAELLVEESLDLSDWIQEGFGTGDSGIASIGTLKVIDLKYGMGVRVDCVDNTQMKIYALGFLALYDMVFDIDTIQMTIYQPRIGNISTWEMSAEKLKDWGENVLKPAAAKAFKGEGSFIPSDKCRFCPGKTKCRALAVSSLEQITKPRFDNVETLTDEEISVVLSKADVIKKWVSSMESYALEEAQNGKKWPGVKLVEGRGSREFSDMKKVAVQLNAMGYQNADIFKLEMKSPAEIEKLLTPKVFKEKLESFIVRTEGKPTLAPIEDPRPEYNSLAQAVQDFS